MIYRNDFRAPPSNFQLFFLLEIIGGTLEIYNSGNFVRAILYAKVEIISTRSTRIPQRDSFEHIRAYRNAA